MRSVTHRSALGMVVLLVGGTATVQAAARPIWTGRSGGYSWVWSDSDITAARFGARTPVLSLKQRLKVAPDRDAQASRLRSATVLSVVGPMLSVRVDDEWTGGAHPSGWTWYQTFDARSPARKTTLTDYILYSSIRKPLFEDKIIGAILRRKGRKAAPETSAQLEKDLALEKFQVGETEHQFTEHPLSEFSFHHVERDQVAIRLNVAWGAEVYRFRTTAIGFMAPIQPQLQRWLKSAAAGREGFLQRTSKSRFKGKQSILMEWSKDPR